MAPDEFKLPKHSVIAKRYSPGIKPGTKIINEDSDHERPLVSQLQRILVDLGHDLREFGSAQDGVDGIFGDKTEEALRHFQKHHRDPQPEEAQRRIQDAEGRDMLGTRRGGALDDGIVGQKTERAINMAVKTQVEVSSDQLFEPSSIPLSVGLLPYRKFKMKVVNEYIITLLDSSGNRFSFEGEGDFEVFDDEENLLAKGIMTDQDDITFKSKKVPFEVKLKVGEDIFIFPLK